MSARMCVEEVSGRSSDSELNFKRQKLIEIIGLLIYLYTKKKGANIENKKLKLLKWKGDKTRPTGVQESDIWPKHLGINK